MTNEHEPQGVETAASGLSELNAGLGVLHIPYCSRIELENKRLLKIIEEILIENEYVSAEFSGFALRLAPNDLRTDMILAGIIKIRALAKSAPNAKVSGVPPQD